MCRCVNGGASSSSRPRLEAPPLARFNPRACGSIIAKCVGETHTGHVGVRASAAARRAPYTLGSSTPCASAADVAATRGSGRAASHGACTCAAVVWYRSRGSRAAVARGSGAGGSPGLCLCSCAVAAAAGRVFSRARQSHVLEDPQGGRHHAAPRAAAPPGWAQPHVGGPGLRRQAAGAAARALVRQPRGVPAPAPPVRCTARLETTYTRSRVAFAVS